MKNKTIKLTTSLVLILTVPAVAGFRLQFETDATGTPTTGGFTGPGTVDPNIVIGGAGQILGVGNGAVFTTEILDKNAAHHFAPDVLSKVTTFSMAGGTVDTTLNGVTGGSHKGFSVTGMGGLTDFGFTTVYSKPVHGRTRNLPTLNAFPMGFATSLFHAGTGFTAADYEITYTVSDIYHSDTPTIESSFSLIDPSATTMVPYASTGWDSTTVNTTSYSFHSSNGFDELLDDPLAFGSGAGNLLLRGFDDDGGSLTEDNVREFYASTYTVDIKPLDSNGNYTTFADDAVFVFSFDGDRSFVPEPSSTALLGLGGLAFILRRRK